jgi:ABC-type branched-subunit amino acid transport system ATPase component/ABC-type branched-subunit amino acid transport system permease subunit
MIAAWVTRQLVADGVVQGLVIGLLAMALVLVYRSNKAINFAVGNMGLVGAGLLVVCNVNYGVPYWLAFAIAVVVGTLYAVAIEVVVIRRLFRAPRVIVLVATIGVAQLSLAILSAYPDLLGEGKPFPQAIGSVWTIAGIRLRGAQIMVVVIAPLVAMSLGWFLNRTVLGRTVKAAAGNPDLARMRGISPKIASTAVWAIGGVLATVSMVLIGAMDGNAGNLQSLGPNTMMRALVAAVVARFTSVRTAILAGVAIGVTQSVLRFNVLDVSGLTDIVLFGVVLIAVWIQSRDGHAQDSPFAYSPRVEAVPARLRSLWWVRHLDRSVLLLVGLTAAAVPLIVTTPSRLQLYASIAAFAICALSLTVLTGWAGQLSLGQMAFAGIGAFTAAAFANGLVVDVSVGTTQLIAFELYPIPFMAAVFAAAAVTMVLSMIIGLGALRVSSHLLAVTTFAFAVAAQTFIYPLDVFTGGKSSAVTFSRGRLFGVDLTEQRPYYYVVLAVLAVVIAVLGRLRRSGVGRVTLAVRDNPHSAASYTVRPVVAKMRAFALAGFLAGLGGALLAGAFRQIPIGQSNFLVGTSLSLVAMVVIGGMGSTAGAVLGALWVVGLPALFPDNDLVPLLSSSLGLLILLLYFPGGFVQIGYSARAALLRWCESRLPPIEKTNVAPPATVGRTVVAPVEHEVVLRTNGVRVTFGGVIANDRVSIEVRNGEIVGLIGTNGAGKSTLMNAIGGFVRAQGRIDLLDTDISHASPADRARSGLGRTFQAAVLFPELTVRETVEVALEARGRTGLLTTALFAPRAAQRERAKRADAADLIDFLGLGRYADRAIGELSTGTRRIVELAGLLALDARMLCLDEPTAGVAQREAEAMGPLLVEIRRQLGASMLVIEHDMPLIMAMSDRIYCLEAGRVIAEGDPAAIRNDPAVIASYLGVDERTIARSGVAAT